MKNEIIVEAGCEGGGLTLYGQRNGQGWLFNRHLVDHTGAMLEDPVWIENDSEVVSTWTAALTLLDKYQFHHLHPVEVHPEFREKVLKAVLSRNKRDKDTYSQEHWQKVCGMHNDYMKLEDLHVETIIQEIEIPRFGSSPGTLLSATPSYAKPASIEKDDWALAILKEVRGRDGEGQNKFVLAVPRSFWPLGREDLIEFAGLAGVEFVDLIDEWDGLHDFGGMTPVASIRQILDHLQRGEDVIILSHKKKMSDFVRAILCLVSMEHSEHPTKFWCGIAANGNGVELTQFQRGYIYGLANSSGPFGLEQLRKKHQARAIGEIAPIFRTP